ncbi:MAG: methyltransferase domain-containing protein [Thermoplasmata archaeon]|nr:methyltransferase domain-containing protein [Thermoplasmata archaeon]
MQEQPAKSKKQMVHTYDSIARHFDLTRYKPWPETMKFAERLKPGSLILDLGCGNGRNLRHLTSKGMRGIGLDISRGQLEITRRRTLEEVPEAEFHLMGGDAEFIPLKDNELDAIIFIATLHHLPSQEARLNSLKEIYRVLRPGGMCLVSAWAREQEKFKKELADGQSAIGDGWEEGDILLPWTLKGEGGVNNDKKFMRYYHLFSEKEFDDLLENTEFKILDRYIACDNHYAVLKKIEYEIT